MNAVNTSCWQRRETCTDSGRTWTAFDPKRKFVTVPGARQPRSKARLSGSVVVLLALMAHSEDRHLAWAVNLEQRDVSRAAERDHEFSQ